MKLSEVKMVVTDMDGTLLNSKGMVSPLFLQLFDELQQHNIHFVAASGRQYHSITGKLNGYVKDITIIAENGGIAKQGETELLFTGLDTKYIQNIIPILRKVEGAYIVLCGKNKGYIESDDEVFINMFKEYYAEFEIVKDLTTVNTDEFLKIAVFHPECSEEHIYPSVMHLEEDLQVKISGKNWLDISHPKANKGYALGLLQQKMGISPAETMVFGDYNNDLEMLELAYFSYAMKNAHPNVKNIARFETDSNDEDGVGKVLEELIKVKKELI